MHPARPSRTTAPPMKSLMDGTLASWHGYQPAARPVHVATKCVSVSRTIDRTTKGPMSQSLAAIGNTRCLSRRSTATAMGDSSKPLHPPENKGNKMNNPNPKTKAILEQVRILAQTYPDFVYSHYDDGLRCKYNTGVNPKYPKLSGCIIGQAARKAGIDTSDWDEKPSDPDYSSTAIFIQIEIKVGEDTYSPEAEVLVRIQELQDIGTTWGKAYTKAMDEAE